VILLLAIAAGLLAGLGWAYWRRQPYQSPELRYLWLIFIAFLPQFVVVYQPVTRSFFPDWLASVLLFASQIMLLGFVWLNRRLLGMSILLCGLVLNLSVMTINGGFMPVSPKTASRLVPESVLQEIQPGSRFGAKDILLSPEDTRLGWLSDRFLPPVWSPYQVAFSFGDVFIALGVFWLLAKPAQYINFTKRGISA